MTPVHELRKQFRQSRTFRDRVRERNQICKATALDDRMFGYIGLNTCHIIPRSHAQLFVCLFIVS